MNPKICAWCVNRYREQCLTRCSTEGNFRNLEPVPLEAWELPPPLPSFRELGEMPGPEKLALIYLGLYYIEYLQSRTA